MKYDNCLLRTIMERVFESTNSCPVIGHSNQLLQNHCLKISPNLHPSSFGVLLISPKNIMLLKPNVDKTSNTKNTNNVQKILFGAFYEPISLSLDPL